MRKRKITNEVIQNGCIDCVFNYGLENFTTKKAANLLGISEGSIYNYYDNTEHVLKDTFCTLNRKINAVLLQIDIIESASLLEIFNSLWHAYLDYLLEHQPEAKFYYLMTHSNYYSADLRKVHSQLLHNFQIILQDKSTLSESEAAFTIKYIVDITLSFAYRCSADKSDADRSDIDILYKLLTTGLSAIVK